MIGDKIMKKLVLVILLMLTAIGCSLLFDPELVEEVKRENEERGRVCERNEKGYWSCFDTK